MRTLDRLAHSHLVIRRLAAAAATAPTAAEAEPSLRELAGVLPAHLDEEEADEGPLGRLRAGGASSRVLQRLAREHRLFRERVPQVLAAVREGAPGAQQQAQRLLHQLLQHEWVETTALARTLEPRPRPREPDPRLEPLLVEILAHVRARGADPAEVEVGVPAEGGDGLELAAGLEHLLCGAGLDYVTVRTCRHPTLDVVAMRFEERWA